ncbi:MAG: thrombospondin type 3 repeat-containing protein [Pseudomonadota bacterium]
MKLRTYSALLSTALALLTAPAFAQTVQFNADQSAATGITGLTVDGTLYDVDFTGRFSHLEWAASLDVTSDAEAEAVMTGIAAALDDAGVTLLEFDLASGGTFPLDRVAIWYGTNATSLLGRSITATGGWSTFIGDSNAPLNNNRPFAVDLIESTAMLDADGDGIEDPQDNCLFVPNADQLDTDEDGFGNLCDADFSNNCIVNVQDLGLFRTAFFSTDPLYDLNQDGTVNFVDLGRLRALFLQPPGPSGVTSGCD